MCHYNIMEICSVNDLFDSARQCNTEASFLSGLVSSAEEVWYHFSHCREVQRPITLSFSSPFPGVNNSNFKFDRVGLVMVSYPVINRAQ